MRSLNSAWILITKDSLSANLLNSQHKKKRRRERERVGQQFSFPEIKFKVWLQNFQVITFDQILRNTKPQTTDFYINSLKDTRILRRFTPTDSKKIYTKNSLIHHFKETHTTKNWSLQVKPRKLKGQETQIPRQIHKNSNHHRTPKIAT